MTKGDCGAGGGGFYNTGGAEGGGREGRNAATSGHSCAGLMGGEMRDGVLNEKSEYGDTKRGQKGSASNRVHQSSAKKHSPSHHCHPWL